MLARIRSIPGASARVLLVAVPLVSLASGAARSQTSQVLVLQSVGQGFEPHAVVTGRFETVLAKSLREPPAFVEVPVTFSSDQGGPGEAAAVEYLASLDAERKFDLLVAVGGSAARFVQRHRLRLFPTTPLLIAGTDRKHLSDDDLSPLDAAVLVAIDIPLVLENILTVLPETNRVEIVIGTSPLERFWKKEIEIASSEIADRAEVVFLDGIPFDRMVARAASVPPRTALLYLFLVIDADGVPHRGDAALATLRAASRAPIFGLFDHQLGKGIVGGPLIPVRKVADETARVAAALLSGRPPDRLRPSPIGAEPPVFDGRELARFDVDERRLPETSTVLFRPPTLWEAHRWRIVGISALVTGQTLLIVALVLYRVRRRRAEEEVRSLTGRLVTAQEEERRRLARELHDDLSQRLARLAIDVGRIERETPDDSQVEALRQVEAGLATVSEDVHALSYRLHPSLLEDLGLVEALEVECERFSDRAGIAAGLAVRALPADIPKDTALCLFRVAQEALRNVERHAHARHVDLDLEGRDGGIALSIRDDGIGIDPSKARAKSGIGLVSMRERVHSFAGAFEVESAAGRGTAVRAFVPAAGGRS